MHATLPLLRQSDFPAIRRGKLEILQVNLGYLCNQSCLHCHVNAGPRRKEVMDEATVQTVLGFLASSNVETLDLTGGAPEMNPYFRTVVAESRALDITVMDRCNLTILESPGYETMAVFLADNKVEVLASLPCYMENNVNAQRGKGVFGTSINALKRLNALGYGKEGSALILNLVYNPPGPNLPPDQKALKATYKLELERRYGVVFNHLFTITNMPIKRFGSTLVSKGQFADYIQLLRNAYREENLNGVMCRNLISIDWRGFVYDCDFNQMLGLPLLRGGRPRTHLSELMGQEVEGNPVAVMDHCYGCTAGQGSGCGGALE